MQESRKLFSPAEIHVIAEPTASADGGSPGAMGQPLDGVGQAGALHQVPSSVIQRRKMINLTQ